MPTLTDRFAFIIASVAGAVGWLTITYATGRREAWDSEWYFGLFMPAIAVLVAWLGFLTPRHPWRWAFGPFAAQALVAVAQNPTGSLLPVGLLVFAVFGAICAVPALVGSAMRRWVTRLSDRR